MNSFKFFSGYDVWNQPPLGGVMDETYPEYYNTDEFIFYDLTEIRYDPESQQHYKIMLFRSIEEDYTIEGNRILPGHPMWRFPDII